ncbi:MAG: hypothetical protein R3C53_10780 [Pirellulaceae bacterium]
MVARLTPRYHRLEIPALGGRTMAGSTKVRAINLMITKRNLPRRQFLISLGAGAAAVWQLARSLAADDLLPLPRRVVLHRCALCQPPTINMGQGRRPLLFAAYLPSSSIRLRTWTEQSRSYATTPNLSALSIKRHRQPPEPTIETVMRDAG